MKKFTIKDFNQIKHELNKKIRKWKPGDASLEDVKDFLSCPEMHGSLMEKAYPVMTRLEKELAGKCTQRLLDVIGIECFTWHKVYNEWDQEELKACIENC